MIQLTTLKPAGGGRPHPSPSDLRPCRRRDGMTTAAAETFAEALEVHATYQIVSGNPD